MRFVTLISRNLIRRGVRTALTVIGLGVGVSAVVSLMGISWGFQRSFMAIYEAKGIDLIVVKAGVGSRESSHLDAGMEGELRKIPGVRDVAGSLFDSVLYEPANLPNVIINGWTPGSLMFRGVRILKGKTLEPNAGREIMIGRVLAMKIGKTVGDEVDLSGEKFKVVGEYETDSLFENGGVIMPVRELQRRLDREDTVSGFTISTEKSDQASVEAVAKRIETTIPGVAASPARDFVQGENQIRLVSIMAWSTSAIAMVLGSLGVLNTMMMTVFERTKEIGILRALGWKRTRVMNLVLGESVLLGLAGSILGSAMAWVSVKTLAQIPMTSLFISQNLPPQVLLLGVLIGVGLSFLGGLYPAIRASSLDPTEALRHE